MDRRERIRVSRYFFFSSSKIKVGEKFECPAATVDRLSNSSRAKEEGRHERRTLSCLFISNPWAYRTRLAAARRTVATLLLRQFLRQPTSS